LLRGALTEFETAAPIAHRPVELCVQLLGEARLKRKAVWLTSPLGRITRQVVLKRWSLVQLRFPATQEYEAARSTIQLVRR
jgi:hypothetical protein